MAGLSYLWVNRASFPFGSYLFFKAWGKRLLCFPELIRRIFRRRSLILKGANIHQHVEIGKLSVEGNLGLLSVGNSTFLGRVRVILHDEVFIGENVCINDGVEILTGSHDVNDPHWKLVTGRVQIDDYVWIGTGAMILPGVHIGRGAVVGARSVVGKSVAPGAIVVGNPAKPISKTRCPDLNYNPCEFLAANDAWLKG